MDVAAWRRELRAALIERRTGLAPEEHQTAAATSARFLEGVLLTRSPQSISCYWPFKGEVDLRGLMARLRDQGWRTALPVVAGRGKPLIFRLWTSESEMETGVHQIPVPRTSETLRPDIVITPLVGFDEQNYRLGYGAGYFDITLASLPPSTLAIGVGFELSRVATIYPSPLDVPMDIIVTEAGVQEK